MSFTVEDMADVVHGAHIRLNARLGDMAPEGPWETLPKDQQVYNRRRITLILRGSSPYEIQADWVRWMMRRGWELGETKDPIAKTHPNLLPLSELPEEQQLKVYLAIAIVREMM